MLEGRRTSPRLLVLGAALPIVAALLVTLVASTPEVGASAQRAPTREAPAPTAAQKAAPTMLAAAVARKPRCSAEMALVEQSCVDRYEAHLLDPDAAGALVPHPPHLRPEGTRYVAASSAGVKPQGLISQVEAARACENAGKRLCSVREWFRACTGSQHTTYPYGQHYEAGRCNVGKIHLLSMLHGASSSAWSYDDFNDPRLLQTPGFLALTGEYAGCASTEGVYDLVGNLHEWVADRVDASLASKLPVAAVAQRRIGKHPGNGVFMGGFFSTLNQHGNGCEFTTAAHATSYHDYSTGFRCCKDAEPASSSD
ncbi:MAG TPA: SUMF1/EgtB/PvdO family nonheme iron enzyme [Polyangiaceae bacterium]|nr:SUMF1/EgtB/PvdO family nonheme iron enzyme [Polyangiaceae bacterium]